MQEKRRTSTQDTWQEGQTQRNMDIYLIKGQIGERRGKDR